MVNAGYFWLRLVIFLKERGYTMIIMDMSMNILLNILSEKFIDSCLTVLSWTGMWILIGPFSLMLNFTAYSQLSQSEKKKTFLLMYSWAIYSNLWCTATCNEAMRKFTEGKIFPWNLDMKFWYPRNIFRKQNPFTTKIFSFHHFNCPEI